MELIVDETADEKSSADCAGAARQYSGTVGAIAMCQVAVTLTCASPAGHALIGRALYLPAAWAADEGRRELAGVPDEVMFATKPQLAGGLLRHARDRGIRAGFTVGDEVYGGLDLRKSIRERGTGYVMGVRSSCRVTLPSGRHLTAKDASLLVKPGMWQRMRTGSATKGARDYHWAMIKITPDDTPGGQDRGHAVLLLRRHRYTGTVSSYLCRTANPVPLARLIKVAVTRWRIEIAFLHLKATVRGSRRPLRGHSPELARQEAWALLLIHNIVATAAARAAAEAGTSPGLIPFAPVLALVRAHIAADVPCPHCGHRPSTAEDQLSDLNAAILALPRHRTGRQRTFGRTTAERRTRRTEEVTYTIAITKSNLPQWDTTPET